MRILTLGIDHETNTFCSTPTTLADFLQHSAAPNFAGGAAVTAHFAGTRTVHGGFLEEARRRQMTVEPLLWSFPVPGGTVEQAAYEHLKDLALTRLRQALPCDGVLLDLHGAMVTDNLEDAEGDLAAAVRAIVGPRMPVVMTLDLHANVTRRMVDAVDMIVGFDQYPHNDMYERGVEAAAALGEIVAERLRPTMAFRMLPLVSMPPNQCTLREPMQSLLREAHRIEALPGVVNVTLISGFPMADMHDAGMSVLVTANDDRFLAETQATAMARAIWARRTEFVPHLTPVAEALAYARKARGLVVLADGSDNPGAGGSCDTTESLAALLADDFPDAVVNCIWDPAAVAAAGQAGVGNEVTVAVGGKTDPQYGRPVTLTAKVKLIADGAYIQRGAMGAGSPGDFGRTVVLVQRGVRVIVTSQRGQPYDAAFPRSLGIEPTHHRLMVVKSIAHFRDSYQTLAEKIFDMDTPGAARPDFAYYRYKKLRRPIYPLDLTVDYDGKS